MITLPLNLTSNRPQVSLSRNQTTTEVLIHCLLFPLKYEYKAEMTYKRKINSHKERWYPYNLLSEGICSQNRKLNASTPFNRLIQPKYTTNL